MDHRIIRMRGHLSPGPYLGRDDATTASSTRWGHSLARRPGWAGKQAVWLTNLAKLSLPSCPFQAKEQYHGPPPVVPYIYIANASL